MLAKQVVCPSAGGGSSLVQRWGPVLLQIYLSTPTTTRCLGLRAQSSADYHRQYASDTKQGGEEGTASSSPSGDSTQQESTTSTSGSSEGSSSSSEGPRDGFSKKFGGTFKSGWQYASSRMKGASSEQGSDSPRRSFMQTLAQEFKEALLPTDNVKSATRVYDGPVATAPAGDYEGPSALVHLKREPSRWEQAWEEVKEKFGHHPLFKRFAKVDLASSAAVRKGQELVEDLKEKYETSDHPMVHKIDDVKQRLFTESDSAQSMKEIRTRDPKFSMMRMIQGLRRDAPTVVKAFLQHDLATLQLYCGPELMERFEGIFKHFEQEGLYEDPTILFVGDVDLVEMRMADGDPVVVVQFHCQQIKCTRDKFGNVMDGSPDSIQRVFYFWGLQQEKEGVVTPEGEYIPPRWVIKDMMWQSMLALV